MIILLVRVIYTAYNNKHGQFLKRCCAVSLLKNTEKEVNLQNYVYYFSQGHYDFFTASYYPSAVSS